MEKAGLEINYKKNDELIFPVYFKKIVEISGFFKVKNAIKCK